MENLRKIVKVTKGKPAIDGAGVQLVRVIGHEDTKDYDPFLMLDAFDSKDPDDYTKGFPWHPHRGIETITYLIKGDIEHGDSLGNSGSIKDGDCQWMTAGSGIIHQEMPKKTERMLGAQLWLNLPASKKMTKPAYGDIKAESVPLIREDGAKIRVISGEYLGQKGAFEGNYIKASYLDVELSSDHEWVFKTPPENTLFVYIFYGEAFFDPQIKVDEANGLIREKQAVLMGRGEKFYIKAGSGDLRFILLSAAPLNEPIAWGGPIVMNTKEELDMAFRELDNNTFIKK